MKLNSFRNDVIVIFYYVYVNFGVDHNLKFNKIGWKGLCYKTF